jgi:hypothetical protein
VTDHKRIAARAGTRRPRPVIVGHTHDDDCTLADDTCTVCGVWHGEACETCGGRGFHLPSCTGEAEDRAAGFPPRRRVSAAAWRRP